MMIGAGRTRTRSPRARIGVAWFAICAGLLFGAWVVGQGENSRSDAKIDASCSAEVDEEAREWVNRK